MPDIPEVQSQKEVQETTSSSVTSPHSKDVSSGKQKEKIAIVEADAVYFEVALQENDYEMIQKLANQGYAAAYGPLAKYYLNNHDYKTAESYAKKAKAAGFSDGASVLKTLENLGYYD